jgi:hypothetical protein
MEAITRFSAGDAIPEKSTAIYGAVLKDQTGTPIDPSAVSVLTVTLTDASGSVVNGLSNENALNTGNGTLVTGGVLSFTLDPADTVILGSNPMELRYFAFHVVFSGGEHWHNSSFYIRNLVGVS